MMAAKKKTPTLAQVRKLAREKYAAYSRADLEPWDFDVRTGLEYVGDRRIVRAQVWLGETSGPEILRVYAPSRSAALRALYAALEAL